MKMDDPHEFRKLSSFEANKLCEAPEPEKSADVENKRISFSSVNSLKSLEENHGSA